MIDVYNAKPQKLQFAAQIRGLIRYCYVDVLIMRASGQTVFLSKPSRCFYRLFQPGHLPSPQELVMEANTAHLPALIRPQRTHLYRHWPTTRSLWAYPGIRMEIPEA